MVKWWRDYEAECEAWMATLPAAELAVFSRVVFDSDGISCRVRSWR